MRPVTSAVRELKGVRAMYEVPRDDIASQLLIPAMNAARRVEIMAGFFSSRAFAQLAPGLAAFIQGTNEPLRLLISPKISDEDRDAIARAVADPEAVLTATIQRLFDGAHIRESAIAAHVADCLAYLVARERIVIRFVLMEQGMFHPKVWLFESDGDVLAVHGSSNPTEAGLLYNGETVSVDRPWADGPAAQDRVAQLREMFQDYWQNKRPHALTIEAPAGLMLAGDHDTSHVPTVDDFWRAWYEDAKKGIAPPLPEGTIKPIWLSAATGTRGFAIPPGLVWDTGPFEHQGIAVRTWESAGRRGILEMATGSGKTTTALIAAHRQWEQEGQLLIVIVAPTRPLISQWQGEAGLFGLESVVPAGTPRQKIQMVAQAIRHLNLGTKSVNCLIVSNDLFSNVQFQAELARHNGATLLVADEAHNLGSTGSVSRLPEFVRSRLALSATPVRQYDPEGTDALLGYFGDVVYRFGLEDAIGLCLVPYDYYVHAVRLTPAETDAWIELTAKIRKQAWRIGAKDADQQPLQRLLIARRKTLETAANKVAVLRGQLASLNLRELRHTLIYATDKGPDQLTQVNALLAELGIRFHQLTDEETGDPQRVARIVGAFRDGTIQVLTAQRVLDEGVNIPEISRAYVLASTTVERQWVQRRGRVLRLCEATGKTHAEIHDFVTLPPVGSEGDGELRQLLHAELDRLRAFSELARNKGMRGGPRETIEQIVLDYFVA